MHNNITKAVRGLRVALGDTQQAFAQRLGLAISTVVRYELSRPPRGKALAQLERVARGSQLPHFAKIFRTALREELGVDPSSVGFDRDSEFAQHIETQELVQAFEMVLSQPSQHKRELAAIKNALRKVIKKPRREEKE